MQKFTLRSRDDAFTFWEVLDVLSKEALRLGLSHKEAVRTKLICEEALTKLLEYSSDDEKIEIETNARRFLGQVNFMIKVSGREFNFLQSIESNFSLNDEAMSPDTSDAINNILLSNFADRLRYTHKKGFNYIRVLAARSPYSSLIKTISAIFLAVIVGLILKNYSSPEFYSSLSTKLFAPIHSTLMNGLKMCAVPLVFFSLVSCISNFGNLADMRKLGLKCISYLFLFQIISAFIGAGVFFIFKPLFSSSAGLFADLINTAETGAVQKNFVLELLTHLIPESFVRPFLNNDVLQLLLVGILFGCAIKMADAKTLAKIINECDAVFTKVMIILLKFIPLMVFCSTVDQVLETGADTLLNFLWIALAVSAGVIIIATIYIIIVVVRCKVSLKSFMKAVSPAMIASASILSGKAVIPTNMQACEKLGVPSEVYSLTIPMSSIFGKNSECVRNVAITLFLAMLCGINVPAAKVISLLFYAIIILMSASGFVSFLATPIYLGVPVAAMELVVGITQLLDIIGVTVNSLGAIASSMDIAGVKNKHE